MRKFYNFAVILKYLIYSIISELTPGEKLVYGNAQQNRTSSSVGEARSSTSRGRGLMRQTRPPVDIKGSSK